MQYQMKTVIFCFVMMSRKIRLFVMKSKKLTPMIDYRKYLHTSDETSQQTGPECKVYRE